jgi:hypothetical protein
VEGAVYLLCTATALACGLLLLRGYGRSRTRLLLWCGIFFLALTLENAILFADVVVFPETDLSAVRTAAALVGGLVLLYGLVWEAK